MKTPVPSAYTSFRYMTRFQCLGSQCEASCCRGGWRIDVDRDHYDRLQLALAASGERQAFGENVRRVKGPASEREKYALMVMRDDGSCGFLDGASLCSLQQRFGAEILPNTCRTYPRTTSVSGARHELSGLTSCPEVARQLLLYPDSMELDEVPSERMSLPPPATHGQKAQPLPYLRHFDEIRGLMLDLLSDTVYPLSSRLFFIAYFAHRTASFFHRGAATLDGNRLLSEVERIQNPLMRAALQRELSGLPRDVSFPLRLVLSTVSGRMGVEAFAELLDAVFLRYGGHGCLDAIASQRGFEPAVQRVAQAYTEHREAWAPWSSRIDGYFTQLAKSYWAREWYVSSPNLLVHTIQLLGRLATLRFLLLGSPLLAAAGDASEDKQRALDRAVVQTVQSYSRAFEHDPEFVTKTQRALSSAHLVSLAHAACLAGF